jgi:hypothetical protein
MLVIIPKARTLAGELLGVVLVGLSALLTKKRNVDGLALFLVYNYVPASYLAFKVLLLAAFLLLWKFRSLIAATDSSLAATSGAVVVPPVSSVLGLFSWLMDVP